MKRFTQFMKESPFETDHPVSVSNYFKHAADTKWQSLWPKIADAVKTGKLLAPKQDTPIASLTPTQKTVSLTKVQKYVDTGTRNLAPGVALHTETKLFLLDGHHRVSADALSGLIQTPIRVLSIQQINDWLSTLK